VSEAVLEIAGVFGVIDNRDNGWANPLGLRVELDGTQLHGGYPPDEGKSRGAKGA
jgi:hypothetical protein